MSDLEIYIELFKRLSMIVKVPEERQKAFIDNTMLRHISAGAMYICQGDVPPCLPFLCSGLMRKYYVDQEAREFTKFFSQPFEFSGAFTSFLVQQPARFSVEALEDSIIVDIPYSFFKSEIKNHLCWLQIYTISLERFYIMKELREERLLSSTGKERYLQFLEDFPHLEPRLKQYHIASYLGLTPVSLSRIKTEVGVNFE